MSVTVTLPLHTTIEEIQVTLQDLGGMHNYTLADFLHAVAIRLADAHLDFPVTLSLGEDEV
jgi:hypothetical protein